MSEEEVKATGHHPADTNGDRKVSEAEKEKRLKFRRSIVVNKPMEAGTVIREEDLGFKRPGNEISPAKVDAVVGRKLVKSLSEDQLIKWSDLD